MKLIGCYLTGLLVALAAAAGWGAAEPAGVGRGPLLYQDDFQKAEPGKLPDGYDVLDGKFAVQEKDGQKYLELPGAPLESFGVLFGPAFTPQTRAGMDVSGRFYGQGQGRRYPAFALGVCGGGGYRLQVAPAKQAVELYQGDRLIASHPYQWKSETWTWLRLQLRNQDGQWLLQGKAWTAGQPEPSAWLITQPVPQEPSSGRPSLWGLPYSGHPIRFDDLAVQSPS